MTASASGSSAEGQAVTRRDRWLADFERWTDLPLTALALALIPILLVPELFALDEGQRETLLWLDYAIWAAFAAELAIKLALVRDRRAFLRDNWIDVVLVALPMLRPLRLGRSVMGLRAVRAARVAVVVLRLARLSRRLLLRHGLLYVLLLALLLVVSAAGLATAFERHAADASIRSFDDALWWAAATVTTVGYGDTYPRTALGRGVGVILMLLGIAVFGVVTANIAAFFVEEEEDAVAAEVRALNERIRHLEELLERRAEGSG